MVLRYGGLYIFIDCGGESGSQVACLFGGHSTYDQIE